MVTTTSAVRLPRRRELSPAAAALLTIGGNILVLGIIGLAVAGVGIAAVAVFGAQLLGAL
jgi:membrane-bound ClpP family serine protease